MFIPKLIKCCDVDSRVCCVFWRSTAFSFPPLLFILCSTDSFPIEILLMFSARDLFSTIKVPHFTAHYGCSLPCTWPKITKFFYSFIYRLMGEFGFSGSFKVTYRLANWCFAPLNTSFMFWNHVFSLRQPKKKLSPRTLIPKLWLISRELLT